MSYVIPSVLVYQQLQTSGGALNATPDLEACIIGPAYNYLKFMPGSSAAAIKTNALSTTSTTGSITANSDVLTVVATGGMAVSDTILVVGAGVSGATLQATILDISGNLVTLDTVASTTVVDAVVSKAGRISNPTVSNTFSLPGQKPGQLIEASSLVVYFSQGLVETASSGATARRGYNGITIVNPATTSSGSFSSGSSSLTVTDPTGFAKRDTITVAGAGTAGGLLTTRITNIVGSVFSVSPACITTVSGGAVVTKVPVNNVNSTTNTLKAEAGDTLQISYVNTSSQASVFETQAREVTTTSGPNGDITSIMAVDNMPADFSVQTTISSVTNLTTIVVASATGLSTGDSIAVEGGATGGGTKIVTISNINTNTLTISALDITPANGSRVTKVNKTTVVHVLKSYSDLEIPTTKPISGSAQFTTSNLATLGQFTINPDPELVYGYLISGYIHTTYRALRNDKLGTILTFDDVSDVEGELVDMSDENPLGLACQLALANTVGRVKAIMVGSNDLTGYLNALTLAESERVYFITPLTQDQAIIAAVNSHVEQMSTPENASWRVSLVNTEIPVEETVGSATLTSPKTGDIVLTAGKYVLEDAEGTFITDGTSPGDIVKIVSGGVVTSTYTVNVVASNQAIETSATGAAAGVQYFITRTLTKSQQALRVKEVSEQFNSSRVIHVQPDKCLVAIDGVLKSLPGYYLCAALAGMGAGFPVQQGFTNISVAGISGLENSNFYFSRDDLNIMAEKGTLIFAQSTQESAPYVRHELTTDISALEYRELLVRKNWDYLSYLYYDALSPFIGSWNITNDTINIIRQTIISKSELEMTRKLPKIGAPLLGYKVTKIEQSTTNKDSLIVDLNISVVYPLNYLNLNLII